MLPKEKIVATRFIRLRKAWRVPWRKRQLVYIIKLNKINGIRLFLQPATYPRALQNAVANCPD